MRDFYQFMHIFFVALLLMAVGVQVFTSIMRRRSNDVQAFCAYLRLDKAVSPVFPVALIGLSVFGVLAAHEIGYRLTTNWLLAAYAAVILAAILPPLKIDRWGRKAHALIPQALDAGKILQAQKDAVLGWQFMAVELTMDALTIFILYDMVYKPF